MKGKRHTTEQKIRMLREAEQASQHTLLLSLGEEVVMGSTER